MLHAQRLRLPLLTLAFPARWDKTPNEGAPIDIYDFPDRYELLVDLPGFKDTDIRIELHERQLVIQATAEKHKQPYSTASPASTAAAEAASSPATADPPASSGGVVLYRERPAVHAVCRVVALPLDVLLDKIGASLENGVLKVTMPKRAADAGRRQKTIQVSKL